MKQTKSKIPAKSFTASMPAFRPAFLASKPVPHVPLVIDAKAAGEWYDKVDKRGGYSGD